MRWVLLTMVIACSSSDKREQQPVVAAQSPAAPVTPPAPSQAPADAALPDAAPDAAIAEAEPPPDPKVEARMKPPVAKGKSVMLVPDAGAKTLAGITFKYEAAGHGHKSDGGWMAMANFQARRGGKKADFGLSFGSDSPGGIAEVTAFGQAFELDWSTGEGMKLTHLGKARPEHDFSCGDAMDKEATAMGLVKNEDNHVFGFGSMGGSGVVTSHAYKYWRVHCGEQSLRVWFSRPPKPRKR
jgi:hypothetical protein